MGERDAEEETYRITVVQAVQNNTLMKAFIPEGPGEQEARSNSQTVIS